MMRSVSVRAGKSEGWLGRNKVKARDSAGSAGILIWHDLRLGLGFAPRGTGRRPGEHSTGGLGGGSLELALGPLCNYL